MDSRDDSRQRKQSTDSHDSFEHVAKADAHDADDDYEEVDASQFTKKDADKASYFNGELGSPQLNLIIRQTMRELRVEGEELQFGEEKKSGDRAFRYYIYEKDHKKRVIFSVTGDSEDKSTNDPGLATAIQAYQKQEGAKAADVHQFDAMVIQRKRGHIVFVSGDFKTLEVVIKDPASSLRNRYSGQLLRQLAQIGFQEPKYLTYGNQSSDFECGFYAYHFLKDDLYTNGRYAPYIHLIAPDREEYMKKYARDEKYKKDDKQTDAEKLQTIKVIACKYLNVYSGILLDHRSRRADTVKDIKNATSEQEIKMLLMRQIDLFDGYKFERNEKVKYSAYFWKVPNSTSLDEGYFSAVVSALAEIDGLRELADRPAQLRALS